MFRGLSWSQAQNERGCCQQDRESPASRPRAGGSDDRAYFLPLVVDFLAVDFLAEEPLLFFALLAAFFVAMALVPPFCERQSKEREKSSQRFFSVANAFFTATRAL